MVKRLAVKHSVSQFNSTCK